MFANFPQLVPQEVCCSCDGCCRFENETTHWRPCAADEDDIDKASIDNKGYLKAEVTDQVCHCTYFSSENNLCSIYHKRPVECQIYPVLLAKHPVGVDVSIHLRCPYVQQSHDTAEFKQYCAQIKEFFSQNDIRGFLKRNQRLFGNYEDYSDEIESICVLGL